MKCKEKCYNIREIIGCLMIVGGVVLLETLLIKGMGSDDIFIKNFCIMMQAFAGLMVGIFLICGDK